MPGICCSWDPTGATLARNIRCHALQTFLHQYHVNFPVGIDAHEAGQDIPLTMHAYRMYGTLTLIFIDRFGIVRYHVFGRPDDMSVGAQVAMLLSERVATGTSNNSKDVKQKHGRLAMMRDVASIVRLTTSFGDQSTRRMCSKLWRSLKCTLQCMGQPMRPAILILFGFYHVMPHFKQ